MDLSQLFSAALRGGASSSVSNSTQGGNAFPALELMVPIYKMSEKRLAELTIEECREYQELVFLLDKYHDSSGIDTTSAMTEDSDEVPVADALLLLKAQLRPCIPDRLQQRIQRPEEFSLEGDHSTGIWGQQLIVAVRRGLDPWHLGPSVGQACELVNSASMTSGFIRPLLQTLRALGMAHGLQLTEHTTVRVKKAKAKTHAEQAVLQGLEAVDKEIRRVLRQSYKSACRTLTAVSGSVVHLELGGKLGDRFKDAVAAVSPIMLTDERACIKGLGKHAEVLRGGVLVLWDQQVQPMLEHAEQAGLLTPGCFERLHPTFQQSIQQTASILGTEQLLLEAASKHGKLSRAALDGATEQLKMVQAVLVRFQSIERLKPFMKLYTGSLPDDASNLLLASLAGAEERLTAAVYKAADITAARVHQLNMAAMERMLIALAGSAPEEQQHGLRAAAAAAAAAAAEAAAGMLAAPGNMHIGGAAAGTAGAAPLTPEPSAMKLVWIAEDEAALVDDEESLDTLFGHMEL